MCMNVTWVFFSHHDGVGLLFKCLTTVSHLCVCVRVCVYLSVDLTFVPLGSQWAGIYPAATNVADRKDKTGDSEDMTTGHMDKRV